MKRLIVIYSMLASLALAHFFIVYVEKVEVKDGNTIVTSNAKQVFILSGSVSNIVRGSSINYIEKDDKYFLLFRSAMKSSGLIEVPKIDGGLWSDSLGDEGSHHDE